MKTCVHCQAEVTLVEVPGDRARREAWSDGKIHPLYCPKALDLTHHVLDEEA